MKIEEVERSREGGGKDWYGTLIREGRERETGEKDGEG